MFVAGMFDVHLRMMEQCSVLISVGMSVATVGIRKMGNSYGRNMLPPSCVSCVTTCVVFVYTHCGYYL
jgi:hypothetical protein